MYDFNFEIGGQVVLITSVYDFIQREKQRIQDERDRLSPKIEDLGGYSISQLSVSRIFGQIEEGEVVGRSEYAAARNSYLVRFKAGDGRQIEDWFTEAAIVDRGKCVERAIAEMSDNGERAVAKAVDPDAAAERAPDVTDTTVDASDKITVDRTIISGDRTIRTFITVPLNT